MNEADCRDLKANYETPEDWFDDPAKYWDAMKDRKRANAIRARRRKIEQGDIPEEESDE